VLPRLVMKSRGIEAAFAFDPDFEAEGFRLLGEA
jgi:predicted nucleic acid-binding protein